MDFGAGKDVFSSTAEICSVYVASEGKQGLVIALVKVV